MNNSCGTPESFLQAEYVLGCIFENGRISVPSLLDELLRQDEQIRQSGNEMEGEADVSPEQRKKCFEEALHKLVLNRYVERVPINFATEREKETLGSMSSAPLDRETSAAGVTCVSPGSK